MLFSPALALSLGFGVAAFQVLDDVFGRRETLSLNAVRSVENYSGSQTGSVDVGSQWYIPIAIGTPSQSFFFLGDSGAPGFSVASTLLPEDEQPPKAPKYDPSKSSTAKQRANYTYSLEYASHANSSGVVYQDVVTIAGLTIPDMDIEVQTRNNHNQTGSTSPRSGNLGLDYDHNGQTTKPTKLPTWLMRVVPMLKAGLFTVDLNTNTSSGTFDFGFINSSRYPGDIGYSSVQNQSTEWTIGISGQQLSNGTVVPTDGWSVVIDTGSGGAGVPQNVANDYFAQINGSSFDEARERFTYPCSSKLPDFTFCIGSYRGVVPGSKLDDGPINGGSTCLSRLEVGKNPNSSLWGQLFIEQFLVIFDWDGARVGFANKGSGNSSSASSLTSAAIPSGTVSSTSTTTPSSTATKVHSNLWIGSSLVIALFVTL